ncbi:hypothetical protein Fmac_002879 [Flemingia macrophylla]|uniref:Uncharacterized protein n=1 Tax=Flemingia macrophylla TaxID=520843 RepID=A0ABD1NL83_9FABA
MTLELAEFGKPFITSIINGCDMVPTLSASSIHNFISEGRTKRKVFLKGARRSINTFGSRLVTRVTKAGMKNKQRTLSGFPWRRKNQVSLSRSKSENLDETCGSPKSCCEPLLTPSDEEESHSPTEGSDNYDEEEQITFATENITAPTFYGISVDEFLNKFKELELEARDNIPSIRAKEKEEVKNNDMTEETNKVVHSEESAGTVTRPENLDRHLFPPGRIMHIVPAAASCQNSDSNENDLDEKQLYLYETPIQLYGKLRLSRRMILDHTMRKYMKVLEQLINQLENSEVPIYMMGDDDSK